jgi:prolipoprotein diacylglyceryltransferase
VWDGGLGIWGAVALAAVAGAWRVHRHGASPVQFMDAVAPALLVAQAIGRIGNYFNQELFGGPTALPWGLEIAPQFRPAGYARYATFHFLGLRLNMYVAGAVALAGAAWFWRTQRRARGGAPGPAAAQARPASASHHRP